jgi:hypothetical protein
MLCHVVESKSALYAVCHSLPFTDNNDEGEALLDAASFTMEVLQYDPACSLIDEILLEEILLLQTGCINFIAVAIHSLSIRKANVNTTQQNTLVQEISVLPDATTRRISIIDSLSAMFRMVVTTITTGEIDWRHHGNELVSMFSPSSRTAVLNSLVMLSKQSQDHELRWIAENVLPPLIKWALGPIDDFIHHPLCVAAGLQLMYTLLARIGSFNWAQSRRTDCLTLRCALNSFNTKDTDNSPDISILRLAALKLMVTTLTIRTTSNNDDASYLSPVEVQKAVEAVNAAARLDSQPEVRSLASEVAPHLTLHNGS